MPSTEEEDQLLAELERVLERCMVNRGNRAPTEVEIKQGNFLEESSTWKDYQAFKQQFPDFDS